MARPSVWLCAGVLLLIAVAVASGHGRRQNRIGGPEKVLVESLRQVLGVPKGAAPPGYHHYRTPHRRPPRYMVHLYHKLSEGHATLPRRANTVRSYMPKPAADDGIEGGLLVYNVSASAPEHVMGAWLTIRGGGVKVRIPPRPRPTRVLLYLLQAPHWQPSTPIITVTAQPGSQEVEVTRAVREALGGEKSTHLVGVRVEELRRGRYVSRAPSKLAKNPPLLLVYSSDPKLLDLASVGAHALNLTVTQVMEAAREKGAGHRFNRYARDVGGEEDEGGETDLERTRRAVEDDPWPELDIMENDLDDDDDEDEDEEENDVLPSSHAHALLTNELPLGTSQSLELPEPKKKKSSPRRKSRGRRRRKHRRKDDNLIPLPENYSRAKWGEDGSRKRNKRNKRRKDTKLPDEWIGEVQNRISNEALTKVSLSGVVGGQGAPLACERHELYIDFRHVGWDDWIVAPAGFRANYCAGVCPVPLTKSMSGSNHAIVQSLIYAMGGRPDIPAPCCVPEKLSPISMLFTDDQDRFVLKNYPKMVVDSCSCQ